MVISRLEILVHLLKEFQLVWCINQPLLLTNNLNPHYSISCGSKILLNSHGMILSKIIVCKCVVLEIPKSYIKKPLKTSPSDQAIVYYLIIQISSHGIHCEMSIINQTHCDVCMLTVPYYWIAAKSSRVSEFLTKKVVLKLR